MRGIGVFVALSFISGVALAAFALGSFAATYNEAGAAYTPSPPTGVSFTNAGANLATLTSPSSATKCTSTDASTSSSPGSLTSGSTTFGCLNSVAITGYIVSDTIEYATVAWSTSAPVSTTYEVSVYFGGATLSPVNIFVKTPATISSTASEIITFDLTSGGATPVTSVTVIVHQCAGSTCP
ncbi:MAG TPA: hypothetical protein VGR56_07835 [Nitrososphaerales archaeon]|nr:hypothetical protein [Nitrososphaerales archaeon]